MEKSLPPTHKYNLNAPMMFLRVQFIHFPLESGGMLIARADAPNDLIGDLLWTDVGRTTQTMNLQFRNDLQSVIDGKLEICRITGDRFQTTFSLDGLVIRDPYDDDRTAALTMECFLRLLESWTKAVELYNAIVDKASFLPRFFESVDGQLPIDIQDELLKRLI